MLQSYTLMKELEKIFKLDDKGNPTTRKIPPLVITGDFNSNPDSGMYQLYATYDSSHSLFHSLSHSNSNSNSNSYFDCRKKLARSHADIQSLSLQDLHLHIPVQSAYKDLGEPLTNITKGFVGYDLSLPFHFLFFSRIPLFLVPTRISSSLQKILTCDNSTLDYIWYNPQLHIHKVLSPITDVIEKYGGMPNLQFSSDHAALMCELEFME